MQDIERLLFYIEPVVYRQDPLLLKPWIEWIARIIRAYEGVVSVSFGIASSPWLCNLLEELVGPTPHFHINPVDVLRPFGMDRALYGRDLAQRQCDPVANPKLQETISNIVEQFRPEAILSFTQNRYISVLRPEITTIFSEMQPMPRSMGAGFFIDCLGHQTESLLVQAAHRIRSLNLDEAAKISLEKEWAERFTLPHIDHPDTDEMLSWFNNARGGAQIVMFAMQPPDWLTLEGLSRNIAPEDSLLDWLDKLPENWKAIATYHPGYQLSRALEARVAEQMPNLLLLPEHWKQGRSEWLLQAVDAVATVSSAVGWTALMAGKISVVLGNSNLTGFSGKLLQEIDEFLPLSPIERINLFGFLKQKYCISEDKFFERTGFLLDRISSLRRDGEYYYFEGIS